MLLQALQQADALKDFVQYVADVAAIGAFGFAWRTNTRVTRLETILTEPTTGVVDGLQGTRNAVHRHGGHLQEHEARLDGHDRDLERLDRDKEPRRLTPKDSR
jgi:hypothetical protein